METRTVRREDRTMREVIAERLFLTIDPATGRLLEMVDNQSDRHVLTWRPVFLATGNMRETCGFGSTPELGGFGPSGPLFSGAKWGFRKAGKSFSLVADLANGCAWRQRFSIDGPTLRVNLRLSNPTGETVVEPLAVSLSAQPGYGGDWPRMKTACLNNQQKAVFADRRGRIEEVYPITIESRTRGFGDVAWLAVTDRTSGQGVWAELPPGRLELFTSKAFDFLWRDSVTLAPGESKRWTFRIAVFTGIDHPQRFADGHLLGCIGNRLARADGGETLRPAAVRLFGVKSEPTWQPVAVRSCEYGRLLDRLGELHDAASKGRAKAILATYSHRARLLEIQRPASQLTALRSLVAEAEQTATAPNPYRSFYSEADLRNMRLLAEGFDAAAAAERVRERLAEPFRIDQPRLRHYDRSLSPMEQAQLALRAAHLAAVCDDRDLAKLAARRLIDVFADAWERFGILMHETIHHGVLLSLVVPAYSLAADLGGFDDDPDGEARVVAMCWDIAEQIHILRRDKHSVSNWQGMEQAGITALLAIFPCHPNAAERIEYAAGQFENLLTKGILTDGIFWEQSLSYHQNVQQFLMTIAEHLVRCGTDLFALPLADRSILELARHTADMLMPNGKAPRFEDGSHNVNAALLAHYARRFRDPRLMAAARFAGYEPGPDDLRWPVEPIEAEEEFHPARCRIMPASGRVVLRHESTAIAMDFGPHGGWHGDWDKMSFELFDAAGPLVCDPGTFRYEEALHWSHFKHTVSHSTVTLDDRRQLACCGHQVVHDCIDDRHTVTAEAKTYPDVIHRRTVRHADGGFGIEDHLEGNFDATEAIFRLTLPAEAKIEGNVLTGRRLRVELIGLAETDRVEVVEIPIMPIETATAHDEPSTTGFQLRWHRPLQAGQREVSFACVLKPTGA